ncbi:Uncharacterised protein [Vibrio cholerae]|nr:Uncharacterised protein [Vibrio cholerae]
MPYHLSEIGELQHGHQLLEKYLSRCKRLNLLCHRFG